LPLSDNKAQRKFNFLRFANYEHLVTERERELHNLTQTLWPKFLRAAFSNTKEQCTYFC